MPGGPSMPQILVESLRSRFRGPRESSTLAMQAAVTADLERCAVAPESPALDYRLELAYLALTPE